MPVNHAIWKVGEVPTPLSLGRLASEQLLEDMICKDIGILSREWMLIGRQETTTHGGRVDLLAMAPDGSLVLIELKRDKTPREIVAQAIDYASWVETLGADKIAQIYSRFSGGGSLKSAFQNRFGTNLDDDEINQAHQIIIVASELDSSTERIIGYLSDRDIAINAVFFKVFDTGSDQLLSRAWLLDPLETQGNVATRAANLSEKEPWNGEYYVSFGDSTSRSWQDARKYGYISAGGGDWYSRTLKLLSPGDRIWVKIPRTGYVGVGVVTEGAVPAREFNVQTDAGERPCLAILKHEGLYSARADDPAQTEYFVRVRWLDTVEEGRAVNETGSFGNQNTVCRPTTPLWRETVDRLKVNFPKWSSEAQDQKINS